MVWLKYDEMGAEPYAIAKIVRVEPPKPAAPPPPIRWPQDCIS